MMALWNACERYLDQAQNLAVRLSASQYVASHTVDHFALIGIMCEARAIPIDSEFGVVQSTLKHQFRSLHTGG